MFSSQYELLSESIFSKAFVAKHIFQDLYYQETSERDKLRELESFSLLTAVLGQGPSYIQGKKMIAIKKMKNLLESINCRLQLILKSEMYMWRQKQTLKTTRQHKAKTVIFTTNHPALRKSKQSTVQGHTGQNGCPTLKLQKYQTGHNIQKTLQNVHPGSRYPSASDITRSMPADW